MLLSLVLSSRGRWMLAVTMAAASILRAETAGADDTMACIESHERAIVHKKAGALREAMVELRACGSVECPDAIRRECVAEGERVAGSIPRFVLRLRDGDGQAVIEAQVAVDDEVVTDELDGNALPVDPGSHELVVTHDGEVLKHRFFAVVGEVEHIDLQLAADDPAPVKTDAFPIPVATWALGGLGLAGMGVFATFGALGKIQDDDLRERCAPNCTERDVQVMRQRYLAADVALIAGGASLVAAGVVLAVEWSNTPDSSQSLLLGPSHVAWRLRF